ncbi:MAG TPA: isochorismatase family protein [Candidatus Methanofastidiosa archaeon]|nr:isochorismatase family protein [Candidatus Methanofastidiosa archaeon]HPR42138.1 isochorismatase family protein [Candidatus Methanofastidiosa archaeon]
MRQRLDRDRCAFVVIDVQDRVTPIQHESDKVVTNIRKFIRGANYFGIPVFILEQNPSKLGKTPTSIVEEAREPVYMEKSTISCLRNKEFLNKLASTGRKQLLLSGSETQICVQKTALEALEAGYEVFVLGDAVTSRTRENVELGLGRIAQAGGVIESTEGALFEFVERSDDEDFKTVLRIIR